MSPSNPSETETDNLVKLFLSCCHRFARRHWTQDVFPFWTNTRNFLTLLALPNQHRRHGPVRWLWEGTSERVIQVVKKELVSMRRSPQYFGTKLDNTLANNILEWEYERMFKDDPLETGIRRNPRMYYQYAGFNDIQMKFRDGLVLSGFVCEGEHSSKIVVAYGNQRRSGIMNKAIVERVNRGKGVIGMGLPFVKCRLHPEKDEWKRRAVEDVEEVTSNYCLLLPYVEKDSPFKQEHAIIYKDWDVGTINFEKQKMTVCEDVFVVDVMDE